MSAVRAYIGLGSNLGDREGNVMRALKALGGRDGIEVADARLMSVETGPAGTGIFSYAAAAIDATLSPRELLVACKEIEMSLGRSRDVPWGPKTIDIDILLYGDEVIQEPDLEIPHPRMHERLYVLAALEGIAPDARHPVLGRTAGELWEAVRSARHGTMFDPLDEEAAKKLGGPARERAYRTAMEPPGS